jgi:spore maturation protein CgeB
MNDKSSRAAIFSLRNIYSDLHFMSWLYEFEDIACRLDSIDLFAPAASAWFKPGNRSSVFIGNKLQIPTSLGIGSLRMDRDYELFVAVCHHPDDILKVSALQGWRERCDIAICLLVELWPQDIDLYKGSMRMLKQFDHVVLNHSTSIEPLSEMLGSKCVYMPPAVDAELFCPYPNPPKRAVDFYSIGRRSVNTHKALLRMARDSNFFYVYDSLKGYSIFNPEEHRFQYANMAKRSRYFLVNPGKIDVAPGAGYPSEFGPRYFEGAAAGCILVGETSSNEEFSKIFHWPDAVVKLQYGSDDVQEVLDQISVDSVREERIRRTNVQQMLTGHDWAHRWESLLALAGLEPLPALLERKAALEQTAREIKS